MEDLKDVRWKYLRESNKKYFDPNRNTSLKDYLEYMFKGHEFVYDQPIPKDIVFTRNSHMKYRRFRPDARCEELSLIIEFDGVTHYQDLKVCLSDVNRDVYLSTLGYKIIRIPYWIQLSNEVIHHLFHDVEEHLTIGDDPMCEIPYSFFDIDKPVVDIGISLGAMCSAGHKRFVEEVQQLCPTIQLQVYEDICRCLSDTEECGIPSEYVVPVSVIKDWGIDDILLDVFDSYMSMEKAELREQILFDHSFILANYTMHGFREFDIDISKYHKLRDNGFLRSFKETDMPVYTDIVGIIESLSEGDYRFSISGVAVSPLREDCCTDVVGFNLYINDVSDPIVSRIYNLKNKYADRIESEELFVESGIAPAGNVHIAVWFSSKE